jgi:hypothetical protein
MINKFITISNLLCKCVFLVLFLIYLVFDIHLSPFIVYCSHILPAMCICTCACGGSVGRRGQSVKKRHACEHGTQILATLIH